MLLTCIGHANPVMRIELTEPENLRSMDSSNLLRIKALLPAGTILDVSSSALAEKRNYSYLTQKGRLIHSDEPFVGKVAVVSVPGLSDDQIAALNDSQNFFYVPSIAEKTVELPPVVSEDRLKDLLFQKLGLPPEEATLEASTCTTCNDPTPETVPDAISQVTIKISDSAAPESSLKPKPKPDQQPSTMDSWSAYASFYAQFKKENIDAYNNVCGVKHPSAMASKNLKEEFIKSIAQSRLNKGHIEDIFSSLTTYGEARGQNDGERVAVMQVIRNRATSKYYSKKGSYENTKQVRFIKQLLPRGKSIDSLPSVMLESLASFQFSPWNDSGGQLKTLLCLQPKTSGKLSQGQSILKRLFALSAMVRTDQIKYTGSIKGKRAVHFYSGPAPDFHYTTTALDDFSIAIPGSSRVYTSADMVHKFRLRRK